MRKNVQNQIWHNFGITPEKFARKRDCEPRAVLNLNSSVEQYGHIPGNQV